ncbi:MAG: acyl-CoA dehydrogenase family protein, partial [Actinomycetes bacterium]
MRPLLLQPGTPTVTPADQRRSLPVPASGMWEVAQTGVVVHTRDGERGVPTVDEHDVVDRIRGFAPALRERAGDAEAARRLPDETVKELKDNGLTRQLQPARYGGMEADPRTFFECVMTAAAACGSTGWVTGVVGV